MSDPGAAADTGAHGTRGARAPRADRHAPLPARALALTVCLLALAAGALLLRQWIEPGTVPRARSWTDPWPLSALVSAALLVGLGLARRAPLAAHAFAALAWCLGVLACFELPAVPSAQDFGDGPILLPLYLALSLALGAHALLGDARDLPARAAGLLLVFTGVNTRLFSRETELVFPLLGAAVLLAHGTLPSALSARALCRGPARRLALAAAAFVAWTLAAAALGDSPGLSLNAWLRVFWGALLAWVLAGTCAGPEPLGPSGRSGRADRAQGAFVALIAVVLAALALGQWEAAQHVGWERVLASRMRHLGLHPNQIGAFFALAIPLLGGELLRELAPQADGERGRRRWPVAAGLTALLALTTLALWRTESEASAGGAVIGLVALAWIASGRLPRRTLPIGAALIGAVVLGAALFASPLGAPARAWLEARTHTQDPLGQRYHFWRMALAAMSEHPLFGLGPNAHFAHARYALPSYYDGTNQSLHAHDLYLAVGEGAGWPALALFAALVLGALELGRRAVLASSAERSWAGAAARGRPAGLLAALIALLASNLLDLGQSQATFVPLLLWIAIGLFGARLLAPDALDASASPSGPSRARSAAALLLLVPVAILPAAGHFAYARGLRLYMTRQPRQALVWERWSLATWPFDIKPRQIAHQAHAALGEHERALDELRAIAAERPGQASHRLSLARALLAQGRADEALAEIDRAQTLDPRGPDGSELCFARAWAHLLRGEREAAHEQLSSGFEGTGDFWKRLPQVRLAAEPGDPPRALRLGFAVGPRGEGGAPIALLSIADDFVERAVSTGPSAPGADAVAARRRLGRAVELYRALGFEERALAALDRYAGVVPVRMTSIDVLYVELLAKYGRVDEAESLRSKSGDAEDPQVRAALARGLAQNGAPGALERAAGLVPSELDLRRRDVFFDGGVSAPAYRVMAQLAAVRGDYETAFDLNRAVVYQSSQPEARVESSRYFFEQLAARRPPADVLLRALDALLAEISLSEIATRDRAALRARAATLAQAWPGERGALAAAAAAAIGPCGPARDAFLTALADVLGSE